MLAFAAQALGLADAVPVFVASAALLVVGWLALTQAMAVFATILGPSLHRLLGGAVLGLYSAWIATLALGFTGA
ncbi:hypothetical protein [Caenispirillum bisanense]|uniref:hypothetical protein n=1 Tax=Caenispirillum bisanense TaxID=414052 RepID=UPI0031DADA86